MCKSHSLHPHRRSDGRRATDLQGQTALLTGGSTGIGRAAERLEGIRQGIPLQRPGLAGDCADAVLHLVSPLEAYLTGEILEINGGQHLACRGRGAEGPRAARNRQGKSGRDMVAAEAPPRWRRGSGAGLDVGGGGAVRAGPTGDASRATADGGAGCLSQKGGCDAVARLKHAT